MTPKHVVVMGLVLGLSALMECAVSDNGVGDGPKPQLRLIGQPYRNQVRRERPPLSAPPYAVPMEPVFKYSQRDPLYDGSGQNVSVEETAGISSKADYDVEQTKQIFKRLPLLSGKGRRPARPQKNHHHPPPHHYPQYYPEPPEPIIEIIIKESNVSLPAPTTTPPPPTTKEPIHVFYVKYQKNPNPKGHEDEIIYEEPIPALNPHQTEIVEGEQPNYGPTYAEAVPTPAPPPSTTLRTIIHPDSERVHGSGLKVTFGSPGSGHGHEAVYGQSAPHPQVALPEEKEGIEDENVEEDKEQEESNHSYTKRQQPLINNQERQDQSVYHDALQQQPIPSPTAQQLANHRLTDISNHNNYQRIAAAQSPQFQNNGVFQNVGSAVRNHPQQHNDRTQHPPQHVFQQQKPPFEQGRVQQQGPLPQGEVTEQQIQEYQRHKEYLLKQQALQSKLSPPPPPPPPVENRPPPHVIHNSGSRFHNRHQIHQPQRPPIPHIHVETSPIIDQSQLSPQVSLVNPQNQNFGNQAQIKPSEQGIGKFSERTKAPNSAYFIQYNQPESNSGAPIKNEFNKQRGSNTEFIKSISSLEDHQIQPALNFNSQENLTPTISRPLNRENQHTLRNHQQVTDQQQRNPNVRFNNRNEEGLNNRNYPQAPAHTNNRYSFRNNHYTAKNQQQSQEDDNQQLQQRRQQYQQEQQQQQQQQRNQHQQRLQQQHQRQQQQIQQEHNQLQEQYNRQQHLQQLQKQQELQQQKQRQQQLQPRQQQEIQQSTTKAPTNEERHPDISKYLTVYSRPPSAQQRRPSQQQKQENLVTTAAPKAEETNSEQNNGPTTEAPENEERKKANIAALPEEVPEDLREQLLSSGILGNADISILDYDKVGDIPIESLPPEALENLYGAASNPVPSIVKPPSSDPQAVEMRVVRYDPKSDEAITNKYFQENATKIDPVFLNDSKYRRYLPLKVSGSQFPIPDVPQLMDRKVNSVVVLAPVDYDFIKPQDEVEGEDEGERRGRVIQIEGVKFLIGDSLMTVIKNPTQDNFKRWLKNEMAVPTDQQSVILLVTKEEGAEEKKEEILMYEAENDRVRKLKGELSKAFVELAASNSASPDLERLGEAPETETKEGETKTTN